MERLHRHRTCQAQHILGEPFTVCTVMRSVYCVYIDYVSQSISMQLIDCFYWGLYIVSNELIVKFSLRVANSWNSKPKPENNAFTF